jgi:Ala-tRNA(Pro) deacylase
MALQLKRYLERDAVRYDVIAHAATTTSSQSAQAAHIPGDRLLKGIVVHHELGYFLAVVPSTHRIELGALQNFVGLRLGLASEEEIGNIFFDCVRGAIPPIGAAYGVPSIIDENFEGSADVYFEGGDHVSLVHVTGDALAKLTTDARRARFSHRAP